jgi:hypothetical protein
LTAAAGLLAEIRAAGAAVVLDGGVLRIRVPRGTLTAVQRERLIEHGAEIATLLAGPAIDQSTPQPAPAPADDLPADLKNAFEERGLDRAAAERLAWAEVNAGPIGDTLAAWRAWMNYRIPVWQALGRSRAEALRSVWAEAECIWHCRHGATPNPDRCAGCGEWMLDGPGMRFIDGAVVHFGNPDRLDCLILYGQAWRTAASAGLVALGLKRPREPGP